MLCVSLTEIDNWLMVSFIKTHTQTQTYIHSRRCHTPTGKWFTYLVIYLAAVQTHVSREEDGQEDKFAKLRFLSGSFSANLSPRSPVLHSGNPQR